MRLTSLFFITVILTNCNEQLSKKQNTSGCVEQRSTVKNTSIDLLEGKLTYCISGETTQDWKLEIEFNPDNALIKEKYARGAARTYIYDKKTKEILGLIDDVEIPSSTKDNYFIYYTPEELIRQSLTSNYGDTTITVTEEFKDILGYKCQKSIIKHGDQATVVVWTTDKIKTGIIYPWTPLTFDKVALEYELKILDRIERKYVIKTIEDKTSGKNNFAHAVPDEYYLVVPTSQFALDPIWAKEYEDNKFKSFTYPYYGDNRDSTLEYLRRSLSTIIKLDAKSNISIGFFVNKNGTLSNVEASINYSKKDTRIKDIEELVKRMGNWIPAKVKNKPVKSKVRISA